MPEVNALEPEIERLSDDQLVAKTAEFKQRVDRARSEAKNPDHEKDLVGDVLDDLLPEAFAVVREAGRRVLGQRHFDVQIMGGAALHFGWVAEMKTGEGKTLVSTLPAYLNALAGRGVHLVTVNDYLARRDAEWMGRLHRFLGLDGRRRRSRRLDRPTRSALQYDCRHHLRHQQRVRLRLPARQHGRRHRASRCSAACATSRGRRTSSRSSTRSTRSSSTRPARRSSSPAGPPTRPSSTTSSPASAKGLQRERDYEVDEAKRTVVPTEEGIERVEEALGVENLYENVQPELRAPAPAGAARQGAVQARRRLHHPRRRGEDRRRVHRPHPRGPPLERRSAPGRRGQRGREDQGGEPDPRDRHAPELLPPVREARRA